MRSTIVGLTLTACLIGVAAPAFAQAEPPPKPLPAFVFDVRAAYVKLGVDTTTATDLAGTSASLINRAAGITAGAHAYPFRRHGFAIGAGAEAIWSRGYTTFTSTTEDGTTSTYRLDRTLTGISGLVSVNFGGRDGWSYLSAGAGPIRFQSARSDIPHGTAPSVMTPNFGGGARWFVTSHLAVGFDVRAYLTPSAPTQADSAGRGRQRVLVIAIGFTLR